MTLKDIRDRFVVAYKIESKRHNIDEMVLPENFIAELISEAQQDIALELNVSQSTQVISGQSGNTTTDYTLNDDFGLFIDAQDGVSHYTLCPRELLMDYRNAQNNLMITIYWSGNNYTLSFAIAPTLPVTILYYQSFGLYSPQLGALQSWGIFDGNSFTGSMNIADRYVPVLVECMLSKLFRDLTPFYERELVKLKSASGLPLPQPFIV